MPGNNDVMLASQKRYEEKLHVGDTILPDPLDSVNRTCKFKDVTPSTWSNIKTSDLNKYVVNVPIEKWVNAVVDNILVYSCPETQFSILTCKVNNGSGIPWITFKTDGTVLNVHCSCMTTLEGSCSHVAVLSCEAVKKKLSSQRMMNYEEKLLVGNTILPDPLNSVTRTCKFKEVTPSSWPSIKYTDVLTYLADERTPSIKEEESVYDILVYSCPNTNVTILTCKVSIGSGVPWITFKKDGTVLSVHCSCMTTLAGSCSHIRVLSMTVMKKKMGLFAKKVGWFALKTTLISAGVLGGIAAAVPALGFTAGGVAVGSLAAAYQSAALGGTIASGSAFATLQSIGAAGLAASTQAAIVGTSAGVAAVTSRSKK